MSTITADYITAAQYLEAEELNLEVLFIHEGAEVSGTLYDFAGCGGKVVVALHGLPTTHYILEPTAEIGVMLP